MYATTTRDSQTGRTSPSGGSADQPRSATDIKDTHAPRIPGQRKPVDDVTHALQHRPEAVSTARHTAHQILAGWKVDGEPADAAVLIVSELVTNAIEHAQPPLALHLHREHTGGRVWVGVSDGGPAAKPGAWTTSCAHDEHGRGITIVDTLAHAHGTRPLPHGGTTHWARLNTA
ncbi:ATP-binding protein [Streptomyces sp. NBC_00289]|uniref:ATP-binding protein n=1 Tax=Streptomyces sp. NBC_00289 TaxID=2975703 RepID=UPI0032457378